MLPEAYDAARSRRWPRSSEHYRDMQDIEFTVEEGGSTCSRPGPAKRTAAAAINAAVDDGRGGPDRAGGGGRRGSTRRSSTSSCTRCSTRTPSSRSPRKGLNASPGAACGGDRLRRRHRGRGARQGRRVGDPRPLGDDARRHPRPDPGEGRPHRARRHDLARRRRRARHGQAVRRRLRGADDRRRASDDRRPRALRGRRDHDRRRHRPRRSSARCRSCRRRSTRTSRRMLEWADDLRRLRVRANADNAEDAAKAREFGAQGIGLCRTEHMFFGEERLPVVQEMILADDRGGAPRRPRPAAAVPAVRLRGDLRGDGRPAGDDPAARPAAARVPARRWRRRATSACGSASAALHEANPMLGTRGCRLGIQYPEIYEMQVRAIARAAKAVAGAQPARRRWSRSCTRSSASARSCAGCAT